jgi:2,4-dienoyl-CoA reductase-like NADH-dependent reductase (Old Yellow Enzyme family)
MAPLLFHAGMLHPGEGAISPSGIEPGSLQQRGEAMNKESIRSTALDFARAAASARLLGFDGGVVDGAGAGLVEQFLRSETNHRHDEYGGDIVSRARFACELVHAVRKAVGSRYPVLFRLPEHCAASPQELEQLVAALCSAGVDIFACVGDMVHYPAFSGSPLNMACWVRMLSQRPVIAEGGVGLRTGSLQQLARSLVAQEFDLVAVGRALLADAEWGRKVRLAREESISPFLPGAVLHLF